MPGCYGSLAFCLREQEQERKAHLADFRGRQGVRIVHSTLSLRGKTLPHVLRIIGWPRQIVRSYGTHAYDALQKETLAGSTAAINPNRWLHAKPLRVRPR